MKNLKNKGFSLVELIIVIAIMAILAAAIAPALIRYIEKSREAVDLDAADEVYRAMSNELLSDKIEFDMTNPASEFRVTVTSTGTSVTTVGVTDPTEHTDAIFASLGIEPYSGNHFYSRGLHTKSRAVCDNATGPANKSFTVYLKADGTFNKDIYFIH
ncbi:MAG: prepilin-type N-terminal cleavage/methylation domain-containing protein [Eubacterium sp.]|nr:prepilin-type N-terminal cleavage/methylation domain-containing protein [Eubacterium sp.]